jgi:hypothetical protein
VENIGGQSDTQTINLIVDNETKTSTELSLANNGREAITLPWNTTPDTAREEQYTVKVTSENTSDVKNININEPPFFEVKRIDKELGRNNKNLVLTVTVKNTGGVKDSQRIRITSEDVDIRSGDSEKITGVPPGDSVSKGISIGYTTESDIDKFSITVSSGNDSKTITIGDTSNQIHPTLSSRRFAPQSDRRSVDSKTATTIPAARPLERSNGGPPQ